MADGRRVTDRLGTGRPIHIEHGHAAGCARLARDQAADAIAQRTRLPALLAASEPAIERLQRHRLIQPVIDDCPRCGWHGTVTSHNCAGLLDTLAARMAQAGHPEASDQLATAAEAARAARGTYHYLCPVPGHAQKGMTGTFMVSPAR